MKKVFLILIIVSLCLSGCIQQNENQTTSENKLIILVSILPQKEMVKEVAGDKAEVYALILPGRSPATYSPSHNDLINVEKARLYFQIGELPFEKNYTNTLADINPALKILKASEAKGIKLQYVSENNVDPHLWLSPKNVIVHVEQICSALSQADPEQASLYRENADRYIEKLENLDTNFRNSFSNLKSNKLMVYHPAWGYLADEYGLEQLAVEYEGKEPTAEQLKESIDLAKQEGIGIIFTQTQFSIEDAQVIASELGVPIVQLDPLAEDYVENMSRIAETISEKLKK